MTPCLAPRSTYWHDENETNIGIVAMSSRPPITIHDTPLKLPLSSPGHASVILSQPVNRVSAVLKRSRSKCYVIAIRYTPTNKRTLPTNLRDPFCCLAQHFPSSYCIAAIIIMFIYELSHRKQCTEAELTVV